MKVSIKTTGLVLLFLSLIFIQIHCGKTKTKETIPAPTLTSVDPVNGIVGDPVQVNGSNLQNADGITFNGISSKIVQATNSSVISVVPNGATAGLNNIAVHTSGGTSNQLQFSVIKNPDHIDPLPPTLSKVLPAANYTDYPLLIYGDNLSGVISLTFNDKDAVVYTNNQKVVTTTVPKNLPSGAVTIKIRTVKGTTSISFQILGPPPAPADINWSIVTIPPPNYIPSISNQWSCGLFSQVDPPNGRTLVDPGSDPTGTGNFNITGRYEYDFNKASNYNFINYVEIVNHTTNEVLAGQFSSKFNNPCVLEMVLISSKDGTVHTCTFDRQKDDPTLVCEK
ncbi:hypothetical protein [Mucilaginibacter sp.]|uniref:hypothetical protein n=1 Tax=Mucilaginibacter sp. TaxID=1882438 RepID=UPI0026320EFE|nr:hypothetical protein [Mucilaginibacter sp.]MDB4922558.1 hypothetical protein [Mucilaginibacter sp.]